MSACFMSPAKKSRSHMTYICSICKNKCSENVKSALVIPLLSTVNTTVIKQQNISQNQIFLETVWKNNNRKPENPGWGIEYPRVVDRRLVESNWGIFSLTDLNFSLVMQDLISMLNEKLVKQKIGVLEHSEEKHLEKKIPRLVSSQMIICVCFKIAQHFNSEFLWKRWGETFF